MKKAALAFLILVAACSGKKTTSSAPAKIGDSVKLDDSEWIIVSASELEKLKPNSDYGGDDKACSGRCIQIRYKVTNTEKKEQMLFDGPKVVDAKGREFGAMADETSYLPAKTKTGMGETLQPNMQKEFCTIVEVPADATGLKALLKGFAIVPVTRKQVDLGI